MIAGADRVKQETVFAIGGVPPVGHLRRLPVWIARAAVAAKMAKPKLPSCVSDLQTSVPRLAGDANAHRVSLAPKMKRSRHPHAVFPIDLKTLVRVTDGRVADIT